MLNLTLFHLAVGVVQGFTQKTIASQTCFGGHMDTWMLTVKPVYKL